VILAAGKGERMSPLTDKIPKALVNVAGKTLLEWAVDRYTQSGIRDIVVAVGWKGAMIERFVSRSNLDVRIVYVPDYEIGPLQTLLTALETIDGDFLLSPVDAMMEPDSITGTLEHHLEIGGIEGMTLAVSSNAESGTLVELGSDGLVLGIGGTHNKSRIVARSAMMLVSHTSIKGPCRSALDNGKNRVVQLLEELLRGGNHISFFDVTQTWFDIDTLSDILAANQYFLMKGDVGTSESVFVPSGEDIEVSDRLLLKSNITLGSGTSLQGPVLLSPNCEIGDYCRVGPNVTVSSNTTLSTGCEISDAVIFGISKVSSQSRAHKTVIYDSIKHDVEV
jgi:NDP-sugar pyrophosphorylase family protein